jgi:hypothetical protein
MITKRIDIGLVFYLKLKSNKGNRFINELMC